MGLYTCFEKIKHFGYTWYRVNRNDTQIGHGAKRQKSAQIDLKPGSNDAEKFADSNDVYNSISPRMALESNSLLTVDMVVINIKIYNNFQ